MAHILAEKKHQKRPELRFQRFFGAFSAKIGVIYYPNSILRPYLEYSRQGKSFIYEYEYILYEYESRIENLFFASRSIFKILSLGREPKKHFLWEKNDIVLLFTSHRTSLAPKTWEKVEFGKK